MTVGNPTEKGWRLGGSYNFGAFKAVAMYQDLKDLGGVTSGGTTIKRKAWVLGGAYTAGNNVFKLQYAKADARSNTTTGASATVDTGAKMWALGWDHLFSKTTKAYIAYAKTDNQTSANFTVNGPSAGAHGDVITPERGRQSFRLVGRYDRGLLRTRRLNNNKPDVADGARKARFFDLDFLWMPTERFIC